MDGKPLSKKDTDVIFWWLKYRNELRVAQRTHLNKAQVKAILERIEVQEEIERQENVLISERMKIQANAENLTNDLLDKELLSLVMLDPETHGAVKQRAIELGLVLTGRIQVGNTKTLDIPDVDTKPATVYQAILSGNVTITPSPILPEANKDHVFPITPPPGKLPETSKTETAGTRHSNAPGKVRIF